MAVTKRYVEIDLDKTRPVRYTINAMRELEIKLGGGTATLFDNNQMGFERVVTLLFYGLKHASDANRKDIPTVEKLGDVLQKHWFDAGKGDLAGLIDIVIDAMRAGGILPPQDEEADLVEELKDDDDPLADV